MTSATTSSDVYNIVSSLKLAVDARLLSGEHAKGILINYLRESGYEAERKPLPKKEGEKTK